MTSMNMWFNMHWCSQLPPVPDHSPWTISLKQKHRFQILLTFILYPYLFISFLLFYILLYLYSISLWHQNTLTLFHGETALIMVAKATSTQGWWNTYIHAVYRVVSFIRKLGTSVYGQAFQSMEGVRSPCAFSQCILFVPLGNWPFTALSFDLFSGPV